MCYDIFMDIVEKLKLCADASYKDFTSKLTPGLKKERILGCRQPDLRALAKQLAAEEAKEFFACLPHFYTEENTMHGLLIGRIYAKDVSGALDQIEKFLPYVDNWAVCDTTVAAMKVFSRFPKEAQTQLYSWLDSGKTYTVRFAAVSLMSYFLDANFDMDAVVKLCALEGGDYYIDMAVAWYFATALAKRYNDVIGVFEEKKLPVWTHNKAIQKAKESFRVTEERKSYLNTLKY